MHLICSRTNILSLVEFISVLVFFIVSICIVCSLLFVVLMYSGNIKPLDQNSISYSLFPHYSFWVEMTGLTFNGTTERRPLLYDHRPYFLFEDDYLRVCQIPKRKVVLLIKYVYYTSNPLCHPLIKYYCREQIFAICLV